jgi:hypothetical protein
MRAMVFALLLGAGCAADAPVAPPVAVPAPVEVRAPTDPPPLAPAALACRVDADCVRVFRRCGSCDCGTAIARDSVAADAAEREARCRDDIAPQCEMHCPASAPRCVASRCALGPDPASSPR